MNYLCLQKIETCYINKLTGPLCKRYAIANTLTDNIKHKILGSFNAIKSPISPFPHGTCLLSVIINFRFEGRSSILTNLS